MYNARASTNISHTDKIWNQVAAWVNMQNRHKRPVSAKRPSDMKRLS